MKIGVSIRVDVRKIDKQRIYKGEKGDYLSMTTFIDTDEKDQYGNNGFISQDVSAEEREAGVKGNIMGNVKVFWSGASQPQAKPEQADVPDFEDDIPFN